MNAHKKIACTAHDAQKRNLLEWLEKRADVLQGHEWIATGSTAQLLREKLGWAVRPVQGGHAGGDYQLASRIVAEKIDLLIFFWEPVNQLPHDADEMVLLRAAQIAQIPIITHPCMGDIVLHVHPWFTSKSLNIS